MPYTRYPRRKGPKRAMTYFVIPFRQNTAKSVHFFTGDRSVAPESLQQFDKKLLICKGEASRNLRWQENCSPSNRTDI
jgi:hypothetical protein